MISLKDLMLEVEQYVNNLKSHIMKSLNDNELRKINGGDSCPLEAGHTIGWYIGFFAAKIFPS